MISSYFVLIENEIDTLGGIKRRELTGHSLRENECQISHTMGFSINSMNDRKMESENFGNI